MPVEPFEWNVVVRGHWNQAILTPAGIAKRIFGFEPGQQIQVEVPIDGLAPTRVSSPDHVVTCDGDFLIIAPKRPTFSSLSQSLEYAAKSLDSLPETPLIAAGYNVRFRSNEPPVNLLALTKTPLDDRLSDCEQEILERRVVRQLRYSEGVVNLTIASPSMTEVVAEMNFHRQSANKNELAAWLRKPILEIEHFAIETLCKQVLGLNPALTSE